MNFVFQNLKGTYALITKTIQNNKLLDRLLKKTKLIQENPQLNVWLAKILVTELILGKGKLQGNSKPVQTVLKYSDVLEKQYGYLQTKPSQNATGMLFFIQV